MSIRLYRSRLDNRSQISYFRYTIAALLHGENRVARAASVLSRVGKAPGVDRQDAVSSVNGGLMGVTAEDDITVPGYGFIDNSCNIHRDSVHMAVCDQNPVSADLQLFLPVEVRKEIIVSRNDAAGTFGDRFYEEFSALHISAVDQHIHGLFFIQGLFQHLIFSVSITHDKYFHIILSFPDSFSRKFTDTL